MRAPTPDKPVAAANPNTVVVMNVAVPTLVPWIGGVESLLQMWWPGQEGGNRHRTTNFSDWPTLVAPARHLAFESTQTISQYNETVPCTRGQHRNSP